MSVLIFTFFCFYNTLTCLFSFYLASTSFHSRPLYKIEVKKKEFFLFSFSFFLLRLYTLPLVSTFYTFRLSVFLCCPSPDFTIISEYNRGGGERKGMEKLWFFVSSSTLKFSLFSLSLTLSRPVLLFLSFLLFFICLRCIIKGRR